MVSKKELYELEERVTDLEESLENNLGLHWVVFCWLFGVAFVGFFGGIIVGDFYTEINEFEYTCEDINKMIVLDKFPRFIEKIVYVNTFYADRIQWDSSSPFKEKDFRNYYLTQCTEKSFMESTADFSKTCEIKEIPFIIAFDEGEWGFISYRKSYYTNDNFTGNKSFVHIGDTPNEWINLEMEDLIQIDCGGLNHSRCYEVKDKEICEKVEPVRNMKGEGN